MAGFDGAMESQPITEIAENVMDRALKMSMSKVKGAPGYTLVEIMVSLLIVFIIMGGVSRTITDETVNMDRQEKILDMQNNVRAVMERLSRDLRRTGSMGCGGEQTANTLSNAGSNNTWVNQYTQAVSPPGQDWDGLSSMLGEIMTNGVNVDYLGEDLAVSNDVGSGHPLYKEGTDAITLVYLDEERNVAPPTSPSDPTTSPISLDPSGAPDRYNDGDILYISDCENYALFQKTSTATAGTINHAATGLNNSSDLNFLYGVSVPAKVFRLEVVPYFVDVANNQLSIGTKGEDIASNIEDLQLEFMIDTDGDDQLTDELWCSQKQGLLFLDCTDNTGTTNSYAYTSKDVRAVRVWVLATSDIDYSYTDNNTYDYPNSPYYTPNPNTTYKNSAGVLKPGNPFSSANGAGGSPASQAPLVNGAEHRYRYLASEVVFMRNYHKDEEE